MKRTKKLMQFTRAILCMVIILVAAIALMRANGESESDGQHPDAQSDTAGHHEE